jgi:alkylation response protein AidB-like acyl-CoA dehydrogenase
MHPTEILLASAQQIADEVLFSNALAADAAGVVPEPQLQCIADAGFYGISTYCDAATIGKIIETFASGCLTTTFVYTQHLGAAAAAHTSDGPVRDELAADMAAGHKRGGVAFAHVLRPGTPMTTVQPTNDGWLLNGTAPWVTGWGHIDVVHAAARHGEDIVWALIDASDSPTLRSDEVAFAVVDSTQTKVLEFQDHHVPASRVTKVENYAEWRVRYQLGLRTNGSLALGVANRCCQLLGNDTLTKQLNRVRDRLDSIAPADGDAMSVARADASLFAMKAATALVAKTGGTSVMMSEHAQRLMREAMFTMVQGQTPAIKAAMLDRLAT